MPFHRPSKSKNSPASIQASYKIVLGSVAGDTDTQLNEHIIDSWQIGTAKIRGYL